MLTIPEICKMLKISRCTFYTISKTNEDFPKPLRLGSLVRYRAVDIDEWINKHVSKEQ